MVATGFDSDAYITEQGRRIRERLAKFQTGKLYLEIGGKYLSDQHAARVLPGFNPNCKAMLFSKLMTEIKVDFILCISARDLCQGRKWSEGVTYEQTIWRTLQELSPVIPTPRIAINLVDEPVDTRIAGLETALNEKGYSTYRRYPIIGYPRDIDHIVSDDGYGKDTYIDTDARLILVIGLGSSCGKLSTCLGQVYLDRLRGLDSGYAKYELFPIWNLPLRHPINLAYEAATADIGDFNVYDKFHQEAHGIESVNYNRDVDAFPILSRLIQNVASPSNWMHSYKSPTDMGINCAKSGIVDERVCISSAIAEIRSRIQRYGREIGPGCDAVQRCQKLLAEAENGADTIH